MVDLVEKYFLSELKGDEEAVLEALLENSAEEALRFSGLALAEYATMGLPEPHFDRRRAAWLSWRWPLGCLLGGALAWLAWPCERAPRPDLGLQAGAFTEIAHFPAEVRVEAPVPLVLPTLSEETPRLQLDPKAPADPVRRGSRLGVVVRQAVEGAAEVDVRDSNGKEIRSLFRGQLKPGQWRFEWDGTLAGGSAAKPGSYDIAVKRGNSLQMKRVQLKENRQ